MPHKKSSYSKQFYNELRAYRKTQRILFNAIPRLFLRFNENFVGLQIKTLSFWIQDKQWTMYGPNDTVFINDKGNTDTGIPCINGYVLFDKGKYAMFKFSTSYNPYEFHMYHIKQYSIYSSYFDNSTKKQGEQIRQLIVEWYRDTLYMAKMERRLKRFKRDLIAAVWHPMRVAKWLEAGAALEDM